MAEAVRPFGFGALFAGVEGARMSSACLAEGEGDAGFPCLTSLSGVGGSGGGVGIASSALGIVEEAAGWSKAISESAFGAGADGATTSSTLVVVFVVCAGFFSEASVFFFGLEAGGGGVGTLSAFVLASGDRELDEWSDGRGSFASGGCALSASVTASAAARSAALEASWGVVGGAGGACEDAEGFDDWTEGFDGSIMC